VTDPDVPANWYPDPAGDAELRYWDGGSWTLAAVKDGQVVDEAMHPDAVASAWEEQRDDRAAWPGRVTLVVAAGAGVAIALAVAMPVLAGTLWDGSRFAGLLASTVGLWSGLLATCWWVSRRYGTGRLGQDYGLRFRRYDIAAGVGLAAGARLLAVVVVVPLVLLLGQPVMRNLRPVGDVTTGIGGSIILVVVLVVGAPVIEELFFRGLLQRALEAQLAPAWAVVAQATVFGLAHLNNQLGVANVVVFASTAVGGVVFGVAARTTRRLGPGIVGHGAFNVLPAILLLVGA